MCTLINMHRWLWPFLSFQFYLVRFCTVVDDFTPQDRTGRIIFKLFDKDPSHLPGTLRTQVENFLCYWLWNNTILLAGCYVYCSQFQIYNWLLNCPSEMESYIRPGCVVLSVYLSMSSSSWQQVSELMLKTLAYIFRIFCLNYCIVAVSAV